MSGTHGSVRPAVVAGHPIPDDELRLLFHRLNNQLGIILACAELIEIKAADETSRVRAAEVVAKVLDALGTSKQIRQQVESQAA